MTPTEIPENDKGWGVRTDLCRANAHRDSQALDGSPFCYVRIEDSGKGEALTHGEAHALLLPFLRKGYYAYRELTGLDGGQGHPLPSGEAPRR